MGRTKENIEQLKQDVENKVKYGSLTIIENLGYIDGNLQVKCKCDCGNEIVVPYTSIKNNHKKICGDCDNNYIKQSIENKTKYGSLTIIENLGMIEDNHNTIRLQVKCKCDCGNEIVVPYTSIKNNHKKSCGDCDNNYIKQSIENKTKYGSLTIIENLGQIMNDKVQHNLLQVKCKCDCGNECIIPYCNLKSGKNKSCGNCNNFLINQDIMNKTKYGRLTITKNNGVIKEHSNVHCKCDCGNELNVAYMSLKNGYTKSCGSKVCKKLITKDINIVSKKYNSLLVNQDIENKTKYGSLTIIENAGIFNSGLNVKCKCDCGNETIIRYINLKNGYTKSCGRCDEFYASKDIENKTKYGSLLPIENLGIVKNERKNRLKIKCKCDCGNETIVNYSGLKYGTIKSCGECSEFYLNHDIETKTKYGSLLPIENLGYKNRSLKVKCKCDCGKNVIFDYSHVKNGHYTNCGCQSCGGSSFAEKELGRYLKSIIKETRYIETEEKQLRLYYNGSKNYFAYDIVVPYNNKNYIVEYNGSPWHPKSPNQLDKNGNPWKKIYSDESAEYWYYYDQKKKQLAIDNGYEYIVVWDDESKETILKRIFDTIGYSENNNHKISIEDFF